MSHQRRLEAVPPLASDPETWKRLMSILYLAGEDARVAWLRTVRLEEGYGGYYRVELIGGESLEPGHVDKLRRRVEDAAAGLLRVLWVPYDENVMAIREEGVV